MKDFHEDVRCKSCGGKWHTHAPGCTLPMSRDPGHPGYLAELDSMKELHRKKASDYGTDQDPFANIRGSVDAGVEPARAAWVRALDKVRRINKHFQGSALVNESVEDSLRDLSAYSLIALVMLREASNEMV